MTESIKRSRFATRVLKIGIAALAMGTLIYLASRSVNGGLAGVLLSAGLAWLGFELALSIVRGIRRARTHVTPKHATFGAFLTAIAACGVGGLLLFFGYQLVVGLILGGIAAVVTNRTELPTLAQMAGLDPMPDRGGGPASFLIPSRRAAAIVALVCVLAGIGLAGLGTFRVLEGSLFATDLGCTHPCGMVSGLWVQVLSDSRGEVVTRLDPVAVRLRVRFWSDVADDRVISRSAFTLTDPPETYGPLADRPGCDSWPPRTLHLDDTSGDLMLCFAIQQSENVDFDQLELDWAQPLATAPILLGEKSRGGAGVDISSGSSPSPSQP